MLVVALAVAVACRGGALALDGGATPPAGADDDADATDADDAVPGLSTGRIDGAAERRMTEHARARRERVRERARERVSGGGKRRSKERNGSAARRARRARRERGSGWREGKWRCGA